MELYLQFAYGMKQIAIDLSKSWGGCSLILSPRDITPKQLCDWKSSFEKAQINCLFDPQCYYPKTNHKGLVQYDYWDDCFSTKLGSTLTFEDDLIKSISNYNDVVNSEEFIIPAAMLNYDDQWEQLWYKQCSKLIEATKKVNKGGKLILTLALPAELLLQKEDEIEKIIQIIGKYDVDGYYIVAHPPQAKYLVDVPLWLTNLIQLSAGLKLQGNKVIVGYGNHQLLCMTAAKVDAMATGTYLNVRRFTNKFLQEDSILRKSTWYYYPAALSEYKMGFLDAAFNNGVLNSMRPSNDMDRNYVDVLFSGAMPSSVRFSETMAFKHYLNCVRVQMKNLSKGSYADTISANEVMLETAMRCIENMEKKGVYAQARSFKDMVDVNKSALQRLEKNYGFQLSKEWNLI